MSEKITKILFFSLLMFCHSIVEAEINCGGQSFFCTAHNAYVICFYDSQRDIFVSQTDRGTICPSGTTCDNNELCDSVTNMDCDGKSFLCHTDSSYLQCAGQPDGSFRTISTEIQYCPPETYCDHNYGDYECISPAIPSDAPIPETTTTTEASTTQASTTTTEASTTQASTTTTEASTTQASTTTTEASTTQASTTTTEASTTQETTTTTEASTTQASTTTTEASTTQETTTSTEASTTQETTTPSTSTKHVPSPSTAAPSLGELPNYVCSGSGLFPHPTDCRRYINCRRVDLTYKNKQYQCKDDLIYQPELRKCTADTKPCEDLEFKCVDIGRFAHPTNPSKFIWCLLLTNGTWLKSVYPCPDGKVFNGKDKCIEESVPIEEFALSELTDEQKLYNTMRRSLSLQDEADRELYGESDELVADRIYLNSNEDAYL